MNKKRALLAMIISIILCLNLINVSKVDAQEDGYNNNILYISSYNPNFITFNDQVTGIKEGLDKNSYLKVEYMNFKTIEDEENIHFYSLIKYYVNSHDNINAVILGDDAALEFGIKYREELFKDLPIVYLGIQDTENIYQASVLDNLYGVIEKPSVEANIDLISNLHPGKKVLAITDEVPSESTTLNEFYSLSKKYDNLEYEHLSTKDMSFYDLKKELNNLNEDYIILLTNQYKDKEIDGNYMGIEESSKFIIENIELPSYCIYDYSVKSGFVGGKVTSHYEQGKKAGEILNNILNNIEPKGRVVDSENINKYMFNYQQLKKFNINTNQLPKNSIIVNSNIDFIMKHKNFLFPIIMLSISLVLVIIAFILYSVKKLKYEKALIEAKEIAESSNKAKNHLISNISHELRTPVALIMSSNQLLELNLQKVENETCESNKNNLNIIKQNCYRLLKLTNNIIDIAKIDTGFMELRLSRINIVSFLEEIVESVIPYAKSKSIDIIFDTTDEVVMMSADLDKTERILLNLLSNAIKFSNENSNIYVNVKRTDDTIIISVKDKGIGISQNHFNKIFDKFTQLDNTMIRKNEGSGIGLSIVKSFVELHEGKISVVSNLNMGSEFIIELPIKLTVEDYEFESEYYNSTLESTNVELSDIYL